MAALDIMYGEDVPPGKQNAMDLLSDAGFAFLGATMFFFDQLQLLITTKIIQIYVSTGFSR